MIGAIATALLELGSSASLYFNEFVLVPRLFRKQRIAYLLALLLMLTVMTVLVVLAIQFVYDQLWKPDYVWVSARTSYRTSPGLRFTWF